MWTETTGVKTISQLSISEMPDISTTETPGLFVPLRQWPAECVLRVNTVGVAARKILVQENCYLLLSAAC